MHYIDYNKTYRTYGELGLPRSVRTYFDHLCDEFSRTKISEKLLHIGYLLWHGYDMRTAIRDTYKEHDSVSEDAVKQTIVILLKALLKEEGGLETKLLQEGQNDLLRKLLNDEITLDELTDLFFANLRSYYHIPVYHNEPHYLKPISEMTEPELKECNPWIEVRRKYTKAEFLYSDEAEFVCSADRELIEQFNKTAKEEHQYKLNVPAYPWYGNPLKAKVILLSLNPGYVESESTVARAIQHLPVRLSEGYAEHLRRMLDFDCGGFLPHDDGSDITYRDLANMHQSWYWWNRLNKAFVNDETGLDFDEVNSRFAVIQYVGYSSVKYAPFKKGQLLPSQNYTRQLIQYILQHNDAVFIVARNKKIWQDFLGDALWDRDRFIESPDYLGQRLTKSILGEDNFNKIIATFKK